MQAQILDALRRGANDEALQQAHAYVATQPDDAQAQHLLAMALRANGDAAAALATVDRAIALAPDDADLHFHRASYLLGSRDVEAAQAALAQSVQLDPNQFGAYVMQAQLALARGDLDEAERIARLAARVAPEHPWVLMLDGSVAMQRGEADRALALLSKAAELAPDDTQVRYALGFAYLGKGHLAFAEQAFRGVLEKTPEVGGLRALIAELLRRQERFADAAAVLAPLLGQADATPALRRFAGELELMAGRNERALPLLRAAFAAQPDDARTLAAMFEAWRRAGDRDEALQSLEAALATVPQSAALWQARLALEDDAAADASTALVARWLAAMPDALPALLAQMHVLDARGEHEAAEASAQRIAQLQPGHGGAEARLLEALAQRDPAAAVARIEAMLPKAESEDAQRILCSWLARTQDRAGQHAQAVATWAALHAQAWPHSLPLPEITAAGRDWPAIAAAPADAPPLAFLVGAPGSGVERLAQVLAGSVPAFRADRFSPDVPHDLLQNFHTARHLASGELDAATVAASWRAQLPARGLDGGQAIDWLLWWDNALLPLLRTQLPQATLLIALRDPRDMLLDWLAFGAPIRLQFASVMAAAGWLAAHLDAIATLDEQSLCTHALLRMDLIHDDSAAVAQALGEALQSSIPVPPPDLFGAAHFPAGHWHAYADALADAFALLTPVARRLGYPDA